MKFFLILITVVVLSAGVAAGVWYFWPNYFGWVFGDSNGVTEESLIIRQDTGHPSVRVQNGRVVASEEYTLSFPFPGRIESIMATEGQILGSSSQPILQMEKTEWQLEMKKAEAQYNEAQAVVRRLEAGARFEELFVLEQRKQSSNTAFKGSRKEILHNIKAVFTEADDAVRIKTDSIFSSPTTNPQLVFTPTDTSLEATVESKRDQIEDTLDDWKDEVDDMKDTGNITKYLNSARKKAEDVREYLDLVGEVVGPLTAGAITQDTIDAWHESISAGRSAVAESMAALGVAESGYRVANKEVTVAQSELDLRLAGTAKQDIEAALSAAVAAKSQMDLVTEKMKQTTLVTPLPGLFLKKIVPQPGEYVAPGEPVAFLTDPVLEFEFDVPEEKIAGIEQGNKIIARLNAYPYEDLTGVVKRIESQEVEKEGGVYFRVRATLDAPHEKIRMGMMGDVVVETQLESGVIHIPLKAIHDKNGRKIVVVSKEGVLQSRVIETGIEQEGRVEVLSGLQVGDEVIISATHDE